MNETATKDTDIQDQMIHDVNSVIPIVNEMYDSLLAFVRENNLSRDLIFTCYSALGIKLLDLTFEGKEELTNAYSKMNDAFNTIILPGLWANIKKGDTSTVTTNHLMMLGPVIVDHLSLMAKKGNFLSKEELEKDFGTPADAYLPA